jgi:hypothetical protein
MNLSIGCVLMFDRVDYTFSLSMIEFLQEKTDKGGLSNACCTTDQNVQLHIAVHSSSHSLNCIFDIIVIMALEEELRFSVCR